MQFNFFFPVVVLFLFCLFMFCYGFNSGDLYVIASGDFCTSQCLAMNYRIFKLSLVKFTVFPSFIQHSVQGFFQLFAQGGGGRQNEIVWIVGGASTYSCAKHVAK